MENLEGRAGSLLEWITSGFVYVFNVVIADGTIPVFVVVGVLDGALYSQTSVSC